MLNKTLAATNALHSLHRHTPIELAVILTKRISLACLLTLLFLYASRYAHTQGVGQTIRLPNNSSITLLGWSYGMYHELVPGQEAKHIDIIPSDPPDPNELASCETEENALVLWIKRAGPAAHVDNLSMHLAWMKQQVRVADENGHEIAPTIAHWRINRTPNSNALTDEPIAFASFPRRGRTVIVRIYSPDATQVLGEFRIPNPVRNLPPPFAVGRFPATAKSGDLELTLGPVVKARPIFFLQNGSQSEIYSDMAEIPAGYKPAPREARRLQSYPTFTFRGKPSTHWALDTMDATLQDASGNHLDADTSGSSNRKLCYIAPDSGEPVRLRIGATQMADSAFLPDRVWAVSGVSVPAAGAIIHMENSIHMDTEGVDLRLLGIAGAGVQKLKPVYLSQVPAGYVAVVLRLSYGGPAPQFLLRVSDARGRSIMPSDPSSSAFSDSPWFLHGGAIGSTYGDYVYWVKVPPDSGKINLTFALNRKHFFEFALPVSAR